MILDGGHVENAERPFVDESDRSRDRAVVDISRIKGGIGAPGHCWNQDGLEHFLWYSETVRCHGDVIFESGWTGVNLQLRRHLVVG